MVLVSHMNTGHGLGHENAQSLLPCAMLLSSDAPQVASQCFPTWYFSIYSRSMRGGIAVH